MKKVAVTGYCGTGSSAVIDLLSEYSTCTTNNLRRYEHVLFYTPDGLFDLEDKLLLGNDIHRSDEAINSFYKEMKRLSKNDFGWFGSYQKLFQNQFDDIVKQFLDDLNCQTLDGKWFANYKGVKFSLGKVFLQLGAKLLQNRTIYKWGRQYIIDGNNKMTWCFPSNEEFYNAARKYVNAYMDMVSGGSDKITVFDHLLLPHNAFRIPNYFDDDFRLIIVDRDVRDMYVLNSYVWPQIHINSPMPKEVTTFIEFWSRMRKSEIDINDKRILRINFESLVYEYDATVKVIEEFIGISSKDHIYSKKYFDPNRSIKNTQTFLMNEKWTKEAELVAKELPEYVYNFPYRIKTSIDEVFDD